MTCVVFTAALGISTDRIRPPLVVDLSTRYVCFSDTPVDVPPYEWIAVPSEDRSMLAARRIKILADHPVLQAADATLWHDASYQLKRGPAWALNRLRTADVVAMRHPRRSSIDAEAVAIARYGYLSLDLAYAHVARYRAAGFREDILTCTGLLGRVNSDATRAFGQLWWAEAQQWGGRDQGSVNYAAWRAGVRLKHVKGTIKDNRYAGWRVPPVDRPISEAPSC